MRNRSLPLGDWLLAANPTWRPGWRTVKAMLEVPIQRLSGG